MKTTTGRTLSTAPAAVQPWTLFAGVLTVILVTEYLIMCVLPGLLERDLSNEVLALLDALILTVILSPLAWWLVVRPQQRENELRTEYIGDLITRIEDERRRISHDLHDGVGQSLTLLISGLRTRSADADVAGLRARDGDLLGFAQRALADVRELSQQLRPSLLDHLGLVAAMEQTIAEMERHHPIRIELTTSGSFEDRPPEAIETNLFRIFQESLSNVIRHADAETVQIRLNRSSETIRLEIEDDGCGPPGNAAPGPSGGLGIRGMRERVARLGGEFTITAGPERGTMVQVSIPLQVVRS